MPVAQGAHPTAGPGPEPARRLSGAGDSGTPARPADDAGLDFVRRPMVRWLDPHQLLGTAARVLAAGFSTAYVDTREQQDHVACGVVDRSGASEIWVDYASDLGDGWNSTYTVAWLLARRALEVDQGGRSRRLPRGDVLVLGGDQVYPVPRRREYENRFLGPYRAALPVPPPSGPPGLLAIPGSHDWYDGLVNFTNVFCRGRTIGGRQTLQSRSYFALALPHGWWLWGVDLQFGDFLDDVQLAYFGRAAGQLRRGDRVVVCLAKEVDSGRRSAEVCSDRDVGYLEREVIRPAGGRVAAYLKSGRHHYARYCGEDRQPQLVTAGGGGAFLHPTHALPAEVAPPAGDGPPLRLAARHPSARRSRRLRWRIWLLPAYNLPLAAVLGAVQVVVALMLGLHLAGRHRSVRFVELPRALWESPTAFVLIIAIVGLFAGMLRLAHDADGLPRLVIAVGHTALQTAGLGTVIVASSHLTAGIRSPALSVAAFLALVWALGGIGAVVGVSGYLWLTNTMGFQANEAYAPLHHADDKGFLRLHVGRDGTLTVYPLAVDRVGRRWRFIPEGPASSAWLDPDGPPPRARLIEDPLVLR